MDGRVWVWCSACGVGYSAVMVAVGLSDGMYMKKQDDLDPGDGSAYIHVEHRVFE